MIFPRSDVALGLLGYKVCIYVWCVGPNLIGTLKCLVGKEKNMFFAFQAKLFHSQNNNKKTYFELLSQNN